MLWGEEGGLCAYNSHSFRGGFSYDHVTDDDDDDDDDDDEDDDDDDDDDGENR